MKTSFTKHVRRHAGARRHDLIASVGRSEWLYAGYQYAFRRKLSNAVVSPATDLCIEAPPGSGNTFFTTGFSIANPAAKIAHHHHVLAQVKRAQRFAIPMLLIVREPTACVLSRAVSWRDPIIVGPAYREWLSFWRGAVHRVEAAVVVDFDTLTSDPSHVVGRINSRFGCRFSRDFPTRDVVFAAMDEAREASEQPSDINPNRPDDRKDRLRSRLGSHVESHRLAQQAVTLYERIVTSHVTDSG